ncbi:MAG: prolyl oligopeptidase family serine peptidase [Pseudomonadota bacterium]
MNTTQPMTHTERRPFTSEDLYLHRKVSSVTCAPGKELAVAVVKSVDREKDSYSSSLWLFTLDGSTARQIATGTDSATSAQWSLDGERLAFLSTVEGSMQIHVMEGDLCEARQLTHLPHGVSDFAWAPDGSFIVATCAVPVDRELRGKRGPSPGEPPRSKAEVAWRLPYKSDGIGYLLRREIHLFRVAANSGEAERLTDGPFDVMGFDVSPDSAQIAYVRTRSGRFAHRTDLWTCDAKGGNPTQVTDDIATVLQPMWAPDGRTIVFAGAAKEGDAQSRFWRFTNGEGSVSKLGDEDVEPASGQRYYWKSDGCALVFVQAYHGRHRPALLGLPDGKLTPVPMPDRQLSAFGGTQRNLVYCVDHPSLPNEVWTCAFDGTHERKLSDLNPWWRERPKIDARIRSFEVPDGSGGTEYIEGWLISAEGDVHPAPVLNDVHGGPASYALMDFDTNVFWQVLCSAGWQILALNPVGSASYGAAFCGRLAGQWGRLDLPQHLVALEQLIHEGVCNGQVVISGKSYGGYLSAYAIGHTDIFNAAIVMAPVGNIETHYGTSDGGYYADPLYMGTEPEFDRELARKLAPMHRVEMATTPTLFMQGKEDERCPKCQSEELFVSLMRAGETPAELVLYPGEDHHFLGEGSPSCREDAARRIVQWATSHVHQNDRSLQA